MEPIIEPVSRSLLLAELTPERKVRNTNKASNEIYIFKNIVHVLLKLILNFFLCQ